MTWSDAARAAAAEARKRHAKGKQAELEPMLRSLRVIMQLKPWGSDKLSRRVGRYLDGDLSALKDMPTLRQKVAKAARVIRVHANPPAGGGYRKVKR